MTRRSHLGEVIGRASEQDAPPPDPRFADQLEERLRLLASGPVPLGAPNLRRRDPWQRVAAVATAAALVGGVLLLTRDRDRSDRVTTLPPVPTTFTPATEPAPTTQPAPTSSTSTSTTSTPPATSPATTVAPTTTTTTRPVRPVETTASPERPEPTTTTTEHKPVTTTTEPKPTTTSTTTKPGGVQDLGLTCRTATIAPATVTCRWSQSTSDRFNDYRVIRLMDNVETTLLETTDRTRVEVTDNTPRTGATIKYGVLARDRNRGTVGQGGPVQFTCCVT